jgi:thiamine transport system permease protein
MAQGVDLVGRRNPSMMATAPGVATRSKLPLALGGTGLAVFVVLFVLPVGALVFAALSSEAGDTPWDPAFLRHVVSFTYLQAFVSALLSGLVGTGAALVYSEARFPGRKVLWRLSLLPFALPTLLVALALLGLWGQAGWLGRFFPAGAVYGWPGLLLGHVFLNFPLFLKGVGTALGDTEREPERAALSLGASRWRCFFTITLRRLLPEIRTAFVLSFLYCSSSFLVVLLLGGGPRFTTLEVAIYQAIKVELNLGLAVRLAAIQAGVSAVLYGLFLRGKPRPSETRSAGYSLYLPRNATLRAAYLGLWAVALGALVGVPILGLAWEGSRSLGVLDYATLLEAGRRSLQLGLMACVLAVLLAFFLAYGAHRAGSALFRGALSFLASFPVAVSTLLLTVGWLVLLRERQDLLRGSLWPAALVQAVIALPAVFRVLRDGFHRIPASLYPAAASLGASPWQVLRTVEVPLLRRALALAAVLALAFSLGELGAVLLFAGEANETLPLWIFRLMGRYRFDDAYGAALLLLCLMGGLFWGIGRLEGKDDRTSA